MDSNNHVFDEKTALWLFTEKQPNLQELASFQFVWKLWSDIMLSGKYHDIKSELSMAIIRTISVATKKIESLRLGSSITKHTTRAFLTIQHSLSLWLAYHKEAMLCGLVMPGTTVRKITLYTCHLKYAVFKPDGEIDYEASARKMLKTKMFDKKISFEIMCRFCMEDELKKLPISEVRKLSRKFSWEKNPLAWYWICYLTGELDTGIPRFTFEDGMVQRECCPYSLILRSLDIDNWTNIQYFWNRLCNEKDQATSACVVLVNINLNWFLKDFYWKLNSEQWRYVFNEIPVDILITFFRQYQENEKGLFLWNRMKSTFTGELFLYLMQRIFHEKTKGAEWSMPIAMEIWQTAEDHLKNHVLKHGNDIIAKNFFEPMFIRKYEKSLMFLFDLLSFASVQYRKQMILKHGDELFVSDDLPGIDKIIELCLPKADDFVQFQKSLTKSTSIALRILQLLTEGKFAYLNEFFDHYLPNDLETEMYKKQAIESNKKGCTGFIFEPTTWSEFEKLIDRVYDDPSAVVSIKKQYIRSFKLNFIKDRGNNEQLNYMEDIVSRYLTEKEVAEFKKSVLLNLAAELQDFVSSYAKLEDDSGKFVDAGFLDKLVSWCFCVNETKSEKSQPSCSTKHDYENVGETVDSDFLDKFASMCCVNEQKIKQFKQTLSMDKIFTKIMRRLTYYLRSEDYTGAENLLSNKDNVATVPNKFEFADKKMLLSAVENLVFKNDNMATLPNSDGTVDQKMQLLSAFENLLSTNKFMAAVSDESTNQKILSSLESLLFKRNNMVILSDGVINGKILSALDEFFKWYFGGVEQAKEFKLAKMFASDNLQLIKDLNRVAKKDSANTGTLLNWLLCYDEEKIAEFKARITELNAVPIPQQSSETKDGDKIDEPETVGKFDDILNVI
ncbi:uncharacterized protein LOC135850085 isoform X1 [Planococcus citri]|uniref:uncharacterized protein LOC135850085 isoform X1 n=1 Tax=Planococcus citri TaxID=170843 RepID=UPI0031F80C3D